LNSIFIVGGSGAYTKRVYKVVGEMSLNQFNNIFTILAILYTVS